MNIEITTGDRELAMQALPVDEYGAPVDLKEEAALAFFRDGRVSTGMYWGPITERWASIAGVIAKVRRVAYLRGLLNGAENCSHMWGGGGNDEAEAELAELEAGDGNAS